LSTAQPRVAQPHR
jgi:hypothetical protein